MSNKEAIVNVVDESQPTNDELLSTKDLNPHTGYVEPDRTLMQTGRFTETETVEQAATSVHTDLQNSEGIKDRVNEIFVGATAKAAEDLYEALCQEMTQTVAKLKITKATTDRSNLVQQIGEINTRISAVLEMFLTHN